MSRKAFSRRQSSTSSLLTPPHTSHRLKLGKTQPRLQSLAKLLLTLPATPHLLKLSKKLFSSRHSPAMTLRLLNQAVPSCLKMRKSPFSPVKHPLLLRISGSAYAAYSRTLSRNRPGMLWLARQRIALEELAVQRRQREGRIRRSVSRVRLSECAMYYVSEMEPVIYLRIN